MRFYSGEKKYQNLNIRCDKELHERMAAVISTNKAAADGIANKTDLIRKAIDDMCRRYDA